MVKKIEKNAPYTTPRRLEAEEIYLVNGGLGYMIDPIQFDGG